MKAKITSEFKQSRVGRIPIDWSVVSIPEISSNFDYKRKPISSAERALMPGPYPYYGAAGILDSINDFRYDGDFLLIAEDGTVTSNGSKPMLQMAHGKFWVSNHAHVLQCKEYQDTLFLYYQLKDTTITPFITGAVQPKLSQRNLNMIKVAWIPNDIERHKVTQIISSLDSKIELNRQMNKTLEAIAQAIFKHWFVDFEFPNEEGKPYKSSGGEMVRSEGLEEGVPKGWSLGKLGEMCKVTMGQSPPGDTYNEIGEGMPFYQGIRDFGFRFPKRRVFCTSPTRLAENEDILLSVRAPVGSLNIANERCCIGRGVASIRHNRKWQSFLYYLLAHLKSNWESFEAEGTVFGAVTKPDVTDLAVVVPSEEIQEKFNSAVRYLDERIRLNDDESRRLTDVRDTLLPKLMSGKVRVPGEAR